MQWVGEAAPMLRSSLAVTAQEVPAGRLFLQVVACQLIGHG
jgi:hypothetical protein